jgi:hypothetical protein
MKIEILPATEYHIREVSNMVRSADKEELWAATMHTPEQAIRAGVENSDEALVGLVDGTPVCIWGVVNDSLIGPVGTPWMIATTALDKHAKAFLRRCRREAMKSFSQYALLENYVHVKNTRAIEWLKWLGFFVNNEPEEYGMLGEKFYKFSMRLNHV